MKKLSFREVAGLLVLCLALCGSAGAQTGPDLTGNSGHGMSAAGLDKPDLSGKTDNSRFDPNVQNMQRGTGPDLTGKVPPTMNFPSPQSATASSGGIPMGVLGLLVAVLVAGAGALLYKGTTLSKKT